ncbi:hypothetical protein SCHPADRAFT_819937 [Schizopora paradoxa]|uniref:peptidylprolyl isomerase n=1 Tax=Schizopora paradoxa TaxID=27342 RepID=A0A0H2S9C4_9AGAM|nr:hypothetical protein SCHPADRAFT_819937 [Schizopora paradoxa]
MLLLSWLSLLLLIPAALSKTKKNIDIIDLKTDITYSPSMCTEKAEPGDTIRVHYTGRLYVNDQKFDSSFDRNAPFELTLGRGQVIKGWEEGLKGMCKNEKRTITIPADMAYGSRGFSDLIPPHSSLVFDVEMLNIKKGKPLHNEL